MPKLLGNLRRDSKAVEKCALATEKAGYLFFGVQYAGECWSGPQAHMTYKKYRTSNRCVNGQGGNWAQDVYEIVSKWCFSDVTFIGKALLKFFPVDFHVANAFNISRVRYKNDTSKNEVTTVLYVAICLTIQLDHCNC